MFSNNTVGGALATPVRCPYTATSCDLAAARRYDLNYFRAYTGTTTSSPGYNPDVPAEYAKHHTVIIYDPRIQEDPPSVLKSSTDR